MRGFVAFIQTPAGRLSIRLLAGWADPEKFQLVRHCFEAALGSYFYLQIRRKTFVHFNYSRAARANQVMVMPIIPFLEQLKSRHAVAQVKSFYHPHIFEQMERSINSGQIAVTTRERIKDRASRKRLPFATHYPKDCLPRAGDFSRMMP